MAKLPSKNLRVTGKIALPSYLALVLITNLLIIIFILFTKNSLPPVVPLFYGVAYGSERLAPVNLLILPSVLSIAIIIINSFMSLFLEDIFLKKTLSLAAIATTLFSLITTIKIMMLVGNYL